MRSLIPNVGDLINWAWPGNAGLVSEWANLPYGVGGGGTTWRDWVRKSSNHGTLTNGPTWAGAAGQPGAFGSISTDGSDDYVDAGAVPLDSSNWTIFARLTFVAGDGSAHRIIAWHGDGPTLYRNAGATGTISIVHSGSIDLDSTDTIVQGETATLAITRAGSNAAIYKNGAQIGSSASFAASYTANSSFRIGSSTAFGENVAANFYAVLAYSRGLSACEIRALHEQSVRGNPNRWRWLRTRPYPAPAGGGVTSRTLLRRRRVLVCS